MMTSKSRERDLAKLLGKIQLAPSIRALLLATGVLALLIFGWSMSAAPPSSPAINLDQASNGGIGKTPVSPVGWENGNQNGQKAHYNEGESIPYRARITGLTSGQTYRATFGYDITHSSKHAIDYITSNQRIAETVNPCQNETTVDVSPCVPGSSNTSGSTSYIPAPAGDPAPGTQLKDIANNSFNNIITLEGPQRVSIFNGEVSAVAFVSEGDPGLSQSETTFSVTFTAGNSTVVLSWGGHIARSFDWGAGNAATGISGSPYHTRAKTLEVSNGAGGFNAPISIGNQDRALASSAVLPPSGCTVSGNSTACNGTTNHHELVGTADNTVTYSWSITNGTGNTSTISAQNTNPASTIYADVAVSGSAGSTYTITLTKSNAAGQTTCPLTVTILQDTAATSLSNQVACPGDTVTFSTTASGAGPFTFVWKKGSVAITNGGKYTITNGTTTSSLQIAGVDSTDAASYSVAATGACNTDTKSATLSVNTTAALTDPADVALCPGGIATFSTTASGTPPAGGFVFTWKKGGVTITNGGKYTITSGATTSSLQITGVDSNDVASYSVSTTGACNSPAQSASLTVKPALSITTPPSDTSACQGSSGPVNFSVVASGAGTLHYAWKVDNVSAGGDSSSLSYNPSSLALGGHTVRVDVTDDCSSTFATANLTINSNPTVTIALSNECASSGTLTATVSNGTGPYTYVWTKDNQAFATHSNIATNTDSISVSATGTYQVTVTDAHSCSGARSGTVCFNFTLGIASVARPDKSNSPSYVETRKDNSSSFYAYLAKAVSVVWKIG